MPRLTTAYGQSLAMSIAQKAHFVSESQRFQCIALLLLRRL
jgi:hypothetical protein